MVIAIAPGQHTEGLTLAVFSSAQPDSQ